MFRVMRPDNIFRLFRVQDLPLVNGAPAWLPRCHLINWAYKPLINSAESMTKFTNKEADKVASKAAAKKISLLLDLAAVGPLKPNSAKFLGIKAIFSSS